MSRLEALTPNAAVRGILPDGLVYVVSVRWFGSDAIELTYKTPAGKVANELLYRSNEVQFEIVEQGRPWSFDGDGALFRLVSEANRIRLAHLFDPVLAVHTSLVEPLPHQITAVYEAMLPRQPLRFLLADDPGAGKTIMAGLLIKELIARGDLQRCLIVCPGSLAEQWQDELSKRFNLPFEILTNDKLEASRTGNWFLENDLVIARLDKLARNEEVQQKLMAPDGRWDLIVCDEAHKMSATFFGGEVKYTKRYRLGQMLSTLTRHFLLMTATPHNGKEEDFQLFMALLDGDRFEGRFRDGAHAADVSDLMRRMVKESLLKFDGRPLFPERVANTVPYKLSPREASLYREVSDYVREEFNRAEALANDKKAGTVGFALTVLQRRLASSPEAIYQSLRRRRERLEARARELDVLQRGAMAAESFLGPARKLDAEDMEDLDEAPDNEVEQAEEEILDQATNARTRIELGMEIATLQRLEGLALDVRRSGEDMKWRELAGLLSEIFTSAAIHRMAEPDGPPYGAATPPKPVSSPHQKLVLFTEHRDTLNYLRSKIATVLGSADAVVCIHGAMGRDERLKVQESFRHQPHVKVLVATDAAGEGINLQRAHLMVNYDLPWNPNRLEQRFGRIHRIGQTEVCHLWNMVASETREGDVFHRLFEKLEVERKALGGRVFDILGEVFEDRSLKDLLIDAIRYGDDPEIRARLHRKVEGALDTQHLETIIKRNALCEEVMDERRLFAVKEEMEKAEARKLQPYFIRSFFNQAFQQLGGELRPREQGRYEITHVPAHLRERDRQIAGRDRRNADPVLRRYERVCFEKQFVRIAGRPSAPMASLVHPAHPLMQAVTDIMLEQHRNKLKQGTVLVDPNDLGLTPKVLFIIDHSIKEGPDLSHVASRRMQFVEIEPKGAAINAGWAPHLDLQAIGASDLTLVQDVLAAPWITQDLEQVALSHASTHLVPEHFNEVRERREAHVDKTMAAVHERLVREINYWSDRYIKLQDDLSAGKDVRLTLENVRRSIDDLTARRESREKELKALRHIVSATPVVAGGAVVIPLGLLMQRKAEPGWSADSEARARVERVAMNAVMAAERALGYEVIDVSPQKCGWDITSIPRAVDGRIPPSRHIEVKGRARGQTTVTVTRNEVLYGLNQQDKFVLAVVLVDGDEHDGPYYVTRPFTQEPDWAVTSINLDLNELLTRAVRARQEP